MEEIIRFVILAQTDRFTLTDLCEQFGISRKTAYTHLERYASGGLKALQPRSHCGRADSDLLFEASSWGVEKPFQRRAPIRAGSA